MTARHFGVVRVEHRANGTVGASVTFRGSREQFSQLLTRLRQDLISVQWDSTLKLWIFPTGLLDEFRTFCLKYGLQIVEKTVTQQRMHF
jgi:hypothetical protein